jgi:hypothetical protein
MPFSYRVTSFLFRLSSSFFLDWLSKNQRLVGRQLIISRPSSRPAAHSFCDKRSDRWSLVSPQTDVYKVGNFVCCLGVSLVSFFSFSMCSRLFSAAVGSYSRPSAGMKEKRESIGGEKKYSGADGYRRAIYSRDVWNPPYPPTHTHTPYSFAIDLGLTQTACFPVFSLPCSSRVDQAILLNSTSYRQCCEFSSIHPSPDPAAADSIN